MREVVSVIVRFHDSARLGSLATAIQSLHSQEGVAVQPIVVLQRFSQVEVQNVQQMLAEQWFFDWSPPPVVINLSTEEGPRDARTVLLNMGLARHFELGNRYLGFLDHDDIMYSHAYRNLVREISESGAAIAFGGIERAHCIPLQSYDFVYSMDRPFRGLNKMDLLRENFCPIHSYLIDTSKVAREILYFDEAFSRLEDYDFLLRIAGSNPCSFGLLKHFIGLYMFPADGRNSTPRDSSSPDDKKKMEHWASQKRLLASRRASYEVRFFASDF